MTASLSTARDHLALALDVDDMAEARKLADRLGEWFGIVKVGLQLFTAAGPAAVEELAAEGRRVFLDLKLFDIPHTVHQAARVAGRLGAGLLTLHTAGGPDMLRAGVEGLAAGAAEAGRDPDGPLALGVTVLTSEPDTSAFDTRLAAAVAGGCDGVVCSVAEIGRVQASAPGLITVVPGIRLPGGDPHDQARVGTPAGARHAGAGILVIGRAVTAAPDPEAAADTLWRAYRDAGPAEP